MKLRARLLGFEVFRCCLWLPHQEHPTTYRLEGITHVNFGSLESAWAFFNRKPQIEPNRTEPNRSVGFFGFWFVVRFLVLHCSVFGFGFGFILKPNRLTEQTL